MVPGRQVKLDPAEWTESLAECVEDLLAAMGGLLVENGGTQDLASLLLHRAAVSCCAQSQARFHCGVELSDSERGHGPEDIAQSC